MKAQKEKFWKISYLNTRSLRGNEDNIEDVQKVMISMMVRKYLYRQAWNFNIIWFIAYFILMFTVGRDQPNAMPDMIWQG